ncbi:MAG TPA: hypothetical protein DEP45_12770 [Armatimonadetes bacterium]|nr:hypothetical protein [Armatimonadota bacterium]
MAEGGGAGSPAETPTDGASDRLRDWPLRLAVVAALAVAIFYSIMQQQAGPLLWPDAVGYVSGAQALVKRGVYSLSTMQFTPELLDAPSEINPVPWWPPGYSAAIALVSGLQADDPVRMVLATHALNLAGQLLAGLGFGVLASLTSGRRIAAPVVAGLYLLSGPVIYEAPRVLSEHLFMALVAWALVAHVKVVEAPHWRYVAVASVFWSAAVLTRYTGAPLAALAGMAGAVTLWQSEDRWRRIAGALVPSAAAWLTLAAWLGRNHFIAGRLTQHYAEAGHPASFKALELLYAFTLGLSGIPTDPNIISGPDLLIAFLGGFFLIFTLVAAGLEGLRLPAPTRTLAWRWLRLLCLVGIPLLLASLLLASLRGRLNTFWGRMMMPLEALTLVFLMGAAIRRQAARVPFVALALCVVVGGLTAGVSNLMLPSGRHRLAEFASIAGSPAMREAVRGRRVLIAGDSCIPVAVLSVPAAVFLPEAEAVYWLDNPGYTGLVLGPGSLQDLMAQCRIEFLLRGPDEYLTSYQEGGIGPEALRRKLHAQLVELEREELEASEDWKVCLPLHTRPVSRAGMWSLEEIVAVPAPTSSTHSER